MPLVDGVKYACLQCIKGHRTSSCRHFDREQIEVKQKGRPRTQCESCREARKTRNVHPRCTCRLVSEEERQQKQKRQPAQRRPKLSGEAPPSTSAGGSGAGSGNRWGPPEPQGTLHGYADFDGRFAASAVTCHTTGVSVGEMSSYGPKSQEVDGIELLGPLRVEALLNPCDCASGNPCICCRASEPLGVPKRRKPNCRCGPLACESNLWTGVSAYGCSSGETTARPRLEERQPVPDTSSLWVTGTDTRQTPHFPSNFPPSPEESWSPGLSGVPSFSSYPSQTQHGKMSAATAYTSPAPEYCASYPSARQAYASGLGVPRNADQAESVDPLTAVYAAVGTCGGGGHCCGSGACHCQAGNCTCPTPPLTCVPKTPVTVDSEDCTCFKSGDAAAT